MKPFGDFFFQKIAASPSVTSGPNVTSDCKLGSAGSVHIRLSGLGLDLGLPLNSILRGFTTGLWIASVHAPLGQAQKVCGFEYRIGHPLHQLSSPGHSLAPRGLLP